MNQWVEPSLLNKGTIDSMKIIFQSKSSSVQAPRVQVTITIDQSYATIEQLKCQSIKLLSSNKLNRTKYI